MQTDDLATRVATLEHALFGFGGESGGVLAELQGLRKEFHAFREDVAKLYKMVTIATFAFVSSVLGLVLSFVLTSVPH